VTLRSSEMGLGVNRFPRVTTVPYTLWWRCYIDRYNQR